LTLAGCHLVYPYADVDRGVDRDRGSRDLGTGKDAEDRPDRGKDVEHTEDVAPRQDKLPPGDAPRRDSQPPADTNRPPDLRQPLDRRPEPDHTGPRLDRGRPPDLTGPTADTGTACTTTGSASCTSGMCTLPPGCFYMGSPTTENCRQTNEPLHRVNLTRVIEVMDREFTVQQFKDLMAWTPPTTDCANTLLSLCPVASVTWHQAAAACNKLNAKYSYGNCYTCKSSGTASAVTCAVISTYLGSNIYNCKGFRLPTEAEWEFAARAKTRTALYSGNVQYCTGKDPYADSIGWFNLNSSSKKQPPAKKKANAFNLYDMSGNVAEWTHDDYKASLLAGTNPSITPATTTGSRVVRGGSYLQEAGDLRSARRFGLSATSTYKQLGFRCVRTVK
jgi:formylglycine-generating enzyme required for sulfatase activity